LYPDFAVDVKTLWHDRQREIAAPPQDLAHIAELKKIQKLKEGKDSE